MKIYFLFQSLFFQFIHFILCHLFQVVTFLFLQNLVKHIFNLLLQVLFNFRQLPKVDGLNIFLGVCVLQKLFSLLIQVKKEFWFLIFIFQCVGLLLVQRVLNHLDNWEVRLLNQSLYFCIERFKQVLLLSFESRNLAITNFRIFVHIHL